LFPGGGEDSPAGFLGYSRPEQHARVGAARVVNISSGRTWQSAPYPHTNRLESPWMTN
jgi:hypothetical protein